MSYPLVSIIVPVYNVEKYLRECIDSIVGQSFTDWELLLIDDGSPDNSGAICDEYTAVDKRIHVFHKTNGGVSSARNMGIKRATGKWLTFIDADDVVNTTFIEGLLKPTFSDDEIDFVQGGCSNYQNGKIISIEQHYDNYISNNKYYVFENFRGLIVSKLFCLENVRQWSNCLELQFDSQMKIAEDMAFTLDYLLTISKYAFVSEVGYYYRRDNENSATKKKKKPDYIQELHAWKHIFKSYSSYVIKNIIDVNRIKYRQKVTADILMATLLTIRQMPCSISKKIARLKNDYSDKEIALLTEASMSFSKKRIVKNLKKQNYRSAFCFMVFYKYEIFFLTIFNKLKYRH